MEPSHWTEKTLLAKRRWRSIKRELPERSRISGLFKEQSVLDNVKIGLHNQMPYSTLTGILRLPKYRKVEAEMNEKAMELLKVFDLDKEG